MRIVPCPPASATFRGWRQAIAVTAAIALLSAGLAGPVRAQQQLINVPVRALESADHIALDGTIEAVRQAAIAAQVAGAITAVEVHAGDAVHTGQVLLRLDGAGAAQSRDAAQAIASEARAELALAQAELKRRKALYEQQYISRAAWEQAQARLKSAQAQVSARQAQAQAAGAYSGHFTVLAPHDGLIGRLDAHLGDMVMPGQPLATVFDPGALRIRAEVPQRFIERLAPQAQIHWPSGSADLPGRLPVQVLPARDAASLTGTIQLALPPGVRGPAPGTPVRITLELRDTRKTRLWVPTRAIVQRTGLRGVYVLNDQGTPLLRQVRLGPAVGDETEILAGVAAGERVVLEPDRMGQGG